MKRKKKCDKQSRKYKKKISKNFIISFSVLFLIVALFLIIGLNRPLSGTTGSSVYVESFGVSNRLMDSQSGKMQTYIKLKQPTLMELTAASVRTKVAEEIANTADFPQGILELYQKNPPAPLHSTTLAAVSVAALAEADNFIKEKVCLNNIGENYGHWGEFEIVLISELGYQGCNDKPGFSYSYMKHTFFNKEGNRFLCRQEGNKLFLINKTSGQVFTNTTTC